MKLANPIESLNVISIIDIIKAKDAAFLKRINLLFRAILIRSIGLESFLY